jgi:O-antigen ligase
MMRDLTLGWPRPQTGWPALAYLVPLLIAVAAAASIVVAGAGSAALVVIALLVVALLLLGQDELVAATLVVTSLLLDWYREVTVPNVTPFVTTATALLVLAVLLLRRTKASGLSLPAYLWAGVALLALAAPAIPRGVLLTESVVYYITVFVTPLLLAIVGILIACEPARVRRLLAYLAAFATLMAIHTIIAATTGLFLLATSRLNDYLASVANFTLASSTTNRIGSFLGNPDWNGAFLAMMLFLPLGLFVSARSAWARLLYAAQVALLALALLFTYSVAAWGALATGVVLFVLLCGVRRLGPGLLALGAGVAVVLLLAFSTEVGLLVQHATATGESSVRLVAWKNGLQVIAANPLSGIGLGLNTYLQRAGSYVTAGEFISLAHPHEAYLELAALAGIPVLLAFLTLLGWALARALANLRHAGPRDRPLLAGAITAALVLTINSLAINGWTLAPLAAIGWLLLGAASSPALARTLERARAASEPTRARSGVLPEAFATREGR